MHVFSVRNIVCPQPCWTFRDGIARRKIRHVMDRRMEKQYANARNINRIDLGRSGVRERVGRQEKTLRIHRERER